jgi:hypothetical protein
MTFRNALPCRPLYLALGVSLLMHSAVLFIGFSAADRESGPGAAPPGRLQTTLARVRPPDAPTVRRGASAPAATIRKAATASRRPAAAPTGIDAKPSWSAAERADMNKFLDELSAERARPPGGSELAARALAMARQMRPLASDDGEAGSPANEGVEPYSLAMYFDAFVRKMNRSAAFVGNTPGRRAGSHKALVEIVLNADGSLKSYRILRSGDQLAEIAYIKSVIDRASPFSAFPRDIRRVGDSLSILMCILPAHAGEGGGGFSRSVGHDCRD